MVLGEQFLQNKLVIYSIPLKLLKDQQVKHFQLNQVIKTHIMHNFQKLILQPSIVLQGMVV